MLVLLFSGLGCAASLRAEGFSLPLGFPKTADCTEAPLEGGVRVGQILHHGSRCLCDPISTGAELCLSPELRFCLAARSGAEYLSDNGFQFFPSTSLKRKKATPLSLALSSPSPDGFSALLFASPGQTW